MNSRASNRPRPADGRRDAELPAKPLPSSGMQLHTADGARKYLTAAERADRGQNPLHDPRLCGCRLSEALALTADRVDLAAGILVLESLRKRKSGIYRAVPPALLDALDLVQGIRERQATRGKGGAGQGSAGAGRWNAGGGRGDRLWPWSPMTGWRAVHAVMEAAKLDGVHVSPKGLRHGFGVAAVAAGIPLNLVQKWLGHAQLTTTAIYANATGAEEQDIARRMWG